MGNGEWGMKFHVRSIASFTVLPTFIPHSPFQFPHLNSLRLRGEKTCLDPS